jgi:hypothetical protein
MTNNTFIARRDTLTDNRYELCDAKAVEYTKGSDDRHANFKRIATRLGLRPEQVLMVYLLKHMDAIEHGLATQEQGTERMDDRIMDAQNYLDLLYTLLHE